MILPEPPPRRSAFANFLRWAASLLFTFVLLFLGYYLYFNVLNLSPADVFIVKRGTAVSAVYGTVTISANSITTILAQNSGYLHLEILGTPTTLNGQVVKTGQLLGTVKDVATERLLTQAKSDYEAAQARRKTGPASAGPLKSAQDQVAAYEKLPPNSVPKVTLDAARATVIQLKNQVENEKLELQHTVDVALATMQTYQEQVSRTRVESPIDGIITLVDYPDGSYVLTNQALFTISSAEMFVSGQVNEEDVGSLKEGMKAELRLYAYPNTNFDATVGQVLPSPGDANSSRYTVTLSMDAPPDNLRYGLTGEMNIILGRKPNAILIPSPALNIDQVLIVNDGVVEQRTVKIGFKSLDYAEILSGINENDEVVVADQDAFHAGERVRPVPTNATAPKSRHK